MTAASAPNGARKPAAGIARTRNWRSLERHFELLALQGTASGGIIPKPQTTASTQEDPITLASAVAKFHALGLAKRAVNV
jgi:hypothetical protein